LTSLKKENELNLIEVEMLKGQLEQHESHRTYLMEKNQELNAAANKYDSQLQYMLKLIDI
jgi:hypothetical protein